VSKLVSILVEENYVKDGGKKKSLQGKRQSLLVLNPEKAMNVVVDISLRKTTLSVVDFSYVIREIKTYKTVPELQKFIPFICEKIIEITEEHSFLPHRVVLSVSGTVDKNLKKVYEVPLLKWKNILLSDLIELELNKRGMTVGVLLENDANLGIISEVMLNREINTRDKNIVFILVKEGIGLGFYLNNGFYFGKSHSAGEFGHMVLDMNADGKKTWLELAGSEELEHYVKKGDLKTYTRILTTGILNIINGLDPDQCVISGACLKYWEEIGPLMLKQIQTESKVEEPEKTIISCSAFKNIESPLLGGAVIGFKDFIEMDNFD
jgi:predicted NBD/HSP70 family sugar kinase